MKGILYVNIKFGMAHTLIFFFLYTNVITNKAAGAASIHMQKLKAQKMSMSGVIVTIRKII